MTIEEWKEIAGRAHQTGEELRKEAWKESFSDANIYSQFFLAKTRDAPSVNCDSAFAAACVAEATIETLLLKPDARLVGAMILNLSPEDRDAVRVFLDALANQGV